MNTYNTSRPGWAAACLCGWLILAACSAPVTLPPAATAGATVLPTAGAGMPNPASVYCEQQGHRVEIRTGADGSQSGVCLFPDGTECDEWAYFRGECSPGSAPAAPTATPPPASTPTLPPALSPLPTPEGGDAGWLTYQQPEYGFAFRFPRNWVVEPDDNPVSTLFGHALFVQPAGEATTVHLRLVFRHVGEDLMLWPTGVGDGEFVERDQLAFGDGWLKRSVLVCDGRDQAVWYHNADGGEIQSGDLEVSFILAYIGSCADGASLSPDVQAIGNQVIASFTAGR